MKITPDWNPLNNKKTPREAFEALEGKKPHLLLTAEKGTINCDYLLPAPKQILGDFPVLLAAFGRFPFDCITHSFSSQ